MHAARLAADCADLDTPSDHHRSETHNRSPHCASSTASVHQPRLFGPFIATPGHATSTTSSSPSAPRFQTCASLSSLLINLSARALLNLPASTEPPETPSAARPPARAHPKLNARQPIPPPPLRNLHRRLAPRLRPMRPPRHHRQHALSPPIRNHPLPLRPFHLQRRVLRLRVQTTPDAPCAAAAPDAPPKASAIPRLRAP